ncbi:VWD domain-containing protein [Nodularia spumigena]|uniref:VWFD domain-containing protein n=1 Tax=Nodularia spumigena UHCC 0039 TaxID=1914872 RepID=A0A2S0Q9Q8_NODSP|nr:VWD domain-containing protein [Nodularia spumigena]AVZ31101.1 hypothetical protein BMF81_03464 [Nodularia spumigena UHCC 0039]EAW43285.1 putative transmembrane protein [Nodularia spumigena CCY9414]
MRFIRFLIIAFTTFVTTINETWLRKIISILLCGLINVNSPTSYAFLNDSSKANAALSPLNTNSITKVEENRGGRDEQIYNLQLDGFSEIAQIPRVRQQNRQSGTGNNQQEKPVKEEDCQEVNAQYKSLNKSLNLLEKTQEKYKNLEAKLAFHNYDYTRITNQLEDISTRLVNAEAQLRELHENVPGAGYKDYLKETQRLRTIDWTSEPSIYQKYQALISKACDKIPDWGDIIPTFKYIGNTVPGYTDNPLLQFAVEQKITGTIGTILARNPYVWLGIKLYDTVSLTCLADQLGNTSLSPAQYRIYQKYQSRINAVNNEITTQVENLMFTESAINAISRERQSAADQIYWIINKELYNNKDSDIGPIIVQGKKPSPEAMLSMLRELDLWKEDLINRINKLRNSPCINNQKQPQPIAKEPEPSAKEPEQRRGKEVKGTSYGDPHLITFDGHRYSFQTVGEFVLAKSTDGVFEVQTRQSPVNKSLSLNSAVAMKIGRNRVAFYSKDFPDSNTNTPLRINGKPTVVEGNSLSLRGGGIIRQQNDSNYVVEWPTGEKVTVTIYSRGQFKYMDVFPSVFESQANQMVGLLGNVNGKANDDLRFRNGNILPSKSTYGDLKQLIGRISPIRLPLGQLEKMYFDQLNKDFGNNWRVSQQESLFDYPQGKSTATFTDKAFPDAYLTLDMLSPTQLENARSQCLNSGVDANLLEGCIFDVGFTGFSEFAAHAAKVSNILDIVKTVIPGFKNPIPDIIRKIPGLPF